MAPCLNYLIAMGFLRKHNWPDNLMNRRYDRCYCESCYPVEQEKTYVVPRGWFRCGIQVDEVIAKHRNVWDDWLVCYHRTNIATAKAIIEHRQMLLPGERKLDGKHVSRKPGRSTSETKQFQTTPTINYAGLESKGVNYLFKYKIFKKEYKVKVVLQCKQKSDSITIRAVETVDESKRICPFVPNDRLEWVTAQRQAIMPYGLLLFIEPVESKPSSEEENLQVNCPNCTCTHSNVWNKTQGIVITCKCKGCKSKFKPFICPSCSSVNCISSSSYEFDRAGELECSNKSCKAIVLHEKCYHCSSLNIWKQPDESKVDLVTCSTETCKKTSLLAQCPHCYWARSCRVFIQKGGVKLTCLNSECLKKYYLVNCDKCVKLEAPKKYCWVLAL